MNSIRIGIVFSGLLCSASIPAASAENIDWDGRGLQSVASQLSLSGGASAVAAYPADPPGRRTIPEAPTRHYRQISGPGGGILLEPAPLYNADGTRAKYQPNMSVGVVRGDKVIEWYPVQYGYYVDSHGRLVKGQHVSFDRHGGTFVSLPWGELPFPRMSGGYLVPNGFGIPAYGVGENPVFHPYVGRIPLRR